MTEPKKERLMRKIALGVVSGAIMGLAAFAVPAVAQDVATLAKQDSTYLVFLTSDGSLPVEARQMIRNAAVTLKHERSVTLEGKPAYVQKVKRELVRNGVSSKIIVDQSMDIGLAVSAGDGIDTANRVVEIRR
jgi:hypothetical protein